MKAKIQEEKKVYVAWTNTDLTEGRGYRVPLVVCDCESTAKRLGQGNSVQGCDAEVTEEVAVRVNGLWCAPVRIVAPSVEDEEKEKETEESLAALERAIRLGLSEEEIAALRKLNSSCRRATRIRDSIRKEMSDD